MERRVFRHLYLGLKSNGKISANYVEARYPRIECHGMRIQMQKIGFEAGSQIGN